LKASRDRAGRWGFVLALLPAILAAAPPAGAALGESLTSVRSDAVQLGGSLSTTAMAGYVAQEIQAPTGTVVREFTSPSGSVFGVSWNGPFLPDLRRILGPSYESYAQAARSHRRGRGPLLIHLPDLVFESAGHPRGFHGRAYIPSLLPEGVPAEAVR
jgi:hypothetical protein